jgi:hypothetical protein
VATHGAPTRTAEKISIYSPSHLFIQDENVIARWEDYRYSVNLFRLSSKAILGMLIFSKRLELLARAAMAESSRLDVQEAPERGIDHQSRAAYEQCFGQRCCCPEPTGY